MMRIFFGTNLFKIGGHGTYVGLHSTCRCSRRPHAGVLEIGIQKGNQFAAL